MRFLVLSHFNIYQGPKIILKVPEHFEFENLEYIPSHLNIEKDNFIVHEYDNLKIANLKFEVPSSLARRNVEELMVSIAVVDEYISPKIFQSILSTFIEEFKNIKDSYKGLYYASEESVIKFNEIKELMFKFYEKIKEIQGVQLNINLGKNLPWGTHLCYFYKKREDLMDILIPYFKIGLENNEFCVYITSEDLNEKEAKTELKSNIKNFNRFLERGQIEIIPYTEWYLKDGEFNFKRVLDEWIEKYNYAIANGYNGLRVSGNTAWIEHKLWNDFVKYEEEINNVVGNYRMIVLCIYSLDKCGVSEILDVVKSHQLTIIRREGKWEILQSYENVI